MSVDTFAPTDATWRYLLQSAYRFALNSPDPSTQNGALIFDPELLLLAAGTNRFPLGVKETTERWARPLKYEFVEHAERNSIYRCAVLGHSTAGATMVCPWAACSDCARAIVCARIVRLVRHQDASDRSPERWIESIKVADTILQEGGVEIIDIAGPVDGPELLHSEVLWTP